MHAELGLGAPGNAEPQLGAFMHFLKSELASPFDPRPTSFLSTRGVETAPRGV